MNGWDRFAGAVGHTTDHAKEVQATNAARDQAVAGLNGYQAGSAEALGRAGTLPVPPGMDLVTRPAGTGTDVSRVGFAGPRGGSTGPGAPGSGSGLSELPGAPGSGAPFSGPGGPGSPGSPGPFGGPPGQPGPTTGIGPLSAPGGPGPAGTPGGLPKGVPNPLFVAETAAIAGAGAAGAAAGSTAEKDRLVRGRPGSPATPAAPGKGTSTLGAVPDDEARAVRNAERFGARTGKPGASPLMQPAAGATRDEDDVEHVRRFGIDSGDVFEDDRLISPALIGDEDEPQKAD